MPVYEAIQRADLPAPPARAFEVMTDYKGLAEWQGRLKRCTVLNRHDNGLGRDVEYEVDAKFRTVTYRLRHTYDPPNAINGEYLDGDFACFEGHWTFAPRGSGAAAQVTVRIDPGFAIPGPLAKRLNDHVLRSSVKDLRRRLEED